MSFPPLPASSMIGRGRSVSSPSQPSFGAGPKWISTVLPTPPDSDAGEEGEAVPLKRPTRHFAAFDLGFIPLTGCSETETSKHEKCYEELEEEPPTPPTPCIKLKDGRELRPLLKHRKRSLSHHAPSSARWNTALSPSRSSASLSSLNQEIKPTPEAEHDHEHEHSHAHVHFSEALEKVCVFDEAAPAHDSDPTHSPLEPPRQRTPPPASPRPRMSRQLRLPGTVIASPTHKAALGFDSSEPNTPQSASPLGNGRDMHLKLACDSCLPSPETSPSHGMVMTLGVRLSPTGDNLTGLARVRNVAFEKNVCIVYTVDDWNTRREVLARWTGQVPQDVPPRPDGYDDFEFHIPLEDLGVRASVGTAVRSKILRFAVRYRAPEQGEWWDNRDGTNWVARFRAVSSDL